MSNVCCLLFKILLPNVAIQEQIAARRLTPVIGPLSAVAVVSIFLIQIGVVAANLQILPALGFAICYCCYKIKMCIK